MSCPLSALAAIATMASGSSTAHMMKSPKKRPAPFPAADHPDADFSFECPPAASSHKKTKALSKTTDSDNDTNQEEAALFQTRVSQASFPAVLMGIMSARQNTEYITFLSDQRSIIIINPEAMVQNVLPMHFEGHVPTYDQFLYLLNVWGFQIIKDPQYPKVKVYQHSLFQKGDWESCLQMKLPKEEADSELFCRAEQLAKPRPPSPRQRHLSFDTGVGDRQNGSSQSYMSSRSVTPPEDITLPLTSTRFMLPSPTISLSQSEGSASRQWMRQSAMLEKMVVATAETRRRLSGFTSFKAAVVASAGECSSPLQIPSEGTTWMNCLESTTGYPNREVNTSSFTSMPKNMGSMSPSMTKGINGTTTSPPSLSQGHQETSDAQLQWMTSNVVSNAIEALQGHAHPSAEVFKSTIMHPSIPRINTGIGACIPKSSSSSSLDAMTEAFLERSLARRMQTRPAGVLESRGSSTAKQLAAIFYNPCGSDRIEAKTRALLASQ